MAIPVAIPMAIAGCWGAAGSCCRGSAKGLTSRAEQVVPHAPLIPTVVAEQLGAGQVEEAPVHPPLEGLVGPICALQIRPLLVKAHAKFVGSYEWDPFTHSCLRL